MCACKEGHYSHHSNTHGRPSLAALIQKLGPNTASPTAETASADFVIAAVRWVAAEKVMSGLPVWDGRIVINGTNPVEFIDPNSPDAENPSSPRAAYSIKAVDLDGKHSRDVFKHFVPGARVMKAFNHLDVNVLPEPEVAGGKRVLFYSGDDAAAKAEVRKLIEDIGFAPVDLRSLDVGGPLASLPFGSLAAQNFIKI